MGGHDPRITQTKFLQSKAHTWSADWSIYFTSANQTQLLAGKVVWIFFLPSDLGFGTPPFLSILKIPMSGWQLRLEVSAFSRPTWAMWVETFSFCFSVWLAVLCDKTCRWRARWKIENIEIKEITYPERPFHFLHFIPMSKYWALYQRQVTGGFGTQTRTKHWWYIQ